MVPKMDGSVNLYCALSCGTTGTLYALKITTGINDSEQGLSCQDDWSSTGEFGDT